MDETLAEIVLQREDEFAVEAIGPRGRPCLAHADTDRSVALLAGPGHPLHDLLDASSEGRAARRCSIER